MARTEKKKRSRPHVRRESVRAKGRRWPSTPSTWKTAPQLDVVKDGGFPDGRYPDGSPRSRLLVSRPMTSIRSFPSFDRAPLMTEGGLGDRSESRLRGDAVFQSVIWILQLRVIQKPRTPATSSRRIHPLLHSIILCSAISVRAFLPLESSRHSGGRFNCTPTPVGTSSFGGVTFATFGFGAFLSVVRQTFFAFGAFVALSTTTLSFFFDPADFLLSFFFDPEDFSHSLALSPNERELKIGFCVSAYNHYQM